MLHLLQPLKKPRLGREVAGSGHQRRIIGGEALVSSAEQFPNARMFRQPRSVDFGTCETVTAELHPFPQHQAEAEVTLQL